MSTTVTTPLVVEPPLLLTTILYVAVPPGGRLTGTDFEIAKRGTVAVDTVQPPHDPLELVTELVMMLMPSVKDPTVTVKDLVTAEFPGTVTLCV